MSKYINTIPLSSIDRMAIVLGKGRLARQVREDVGCDLTINLGFFNGSKPVGHLKIDGKVLSKPDWGCWGYAWDNGGDIKMEALPSPKANYISGTELLTPMVGLGDSIPYDHEKLGGARGRTALALGVEKLITYCANDGKDGATMEGLQTELYELGAETAIGADGGGSSQGSGDSWDVRSSDVPERPVHNYLCIWLKKESKEDKPVSKTVCLDPGHGPGCVNGSPDGSYKEYEFAWDMSQRVKTHLERCGVKVVMTKDESGYPSLTERADVSNKSKADLFVSLHSNAEGNAGWGAARGFLIYTSMGPMTAGRNVAALKIIDRMSAAGVVLGKNTIQYNAEYTVLVKTNAPAMIVEHGFHTNKEDVALLKTTEYRAKLAEATAKGVCDFLGIAWADYPVGDGTTSGADDWAAGAWAKAKDKGIMDGTRPTEPVTRQELAVVLDRAGMLK
ncbi:putative N-acetylmuramoyl-L-alanine amidase [uncultured Eubacteriales bacterium]|uniref:Putative N-acetylmuramoyl-L-alanine amidase n=1 Tax=uncultured Eubacteriales bacterium TaxID=172733 RepID=A0A212JSI3_9FIRM|nr:putative N-acetylmuramoyl-L-alanine amidase [uncultured Eubacteriales bacterium]